MNQPKRNKDPRYLLVLALLLCIVALVSATGTVQARYQAARDKQLVFQVRSPAQVSLGVMKTETAEDGTTTEVFDPDGTLAWRTETENELYLLDLVIANGISSESCSEKDQIVSLRLIGSAGIGEDTRITLRIPPKTEEDQPIEIPAVVTPVEEGTALYVTNGYGYVYTFHQQTQGEEEPGEELTWLLPGKTFATIPLTVVMQGKLPEHISLLQPQVVAELAE